jgi:hypothetical protein
MPRLSNDPRRPSFLVLTGFLIFASVAAAAPPSTSFFPPVPQTVSTVPGNGDQNPYGVAFAPVSVGTRYVLQPGDLLISNFNNGANQQGLGHTIVLIRAGVQSLFFSAPPALTVGWSGALGILSNGIVVAGNTPTTDGHRTLAAKICLQVGHQQGCRDSLA